MKIRFGLPGLAALLALSLALAAVAFSQGRPAPAPGRAAARTSGGPARHCNDCHGKQVSEYEQEEVRARRRSARTTAPPATRSHGFSQHLVLKKASEAAVHRLPRGRWSRRRPVPHQHPAFKQGDCLACHDPHASNRPHLVRDDTPQGSCFACHQPQADEAKLAHVHAPFARRELRPPATTRTTGRTPALLKRGRRRPVHGLPRARAGGREAREDGPRRTRAASTATPRTRSASAALRRSTAHAPVADGRMRRVPRASRPASRASKLVATGGKLCIECHDDKAGLDKRASAHPPVADGECLECHDPHRGSAAGKLLRARPQQLCMPCATRTCPRSSRSPSSTRPSRTVNAPRATTRTAPRTSTSRRRPTAPCASSATRTSSTTSPTPGRASSGGAERLPALPRARTRAPAASSASRTSRRSAELPPRLRRSHARQDRPLAVLGRQLHRLPRAARLPAAAPGPGRRRRALHPLPRRDRSRARPRARPRARQGGPVPQLPRTARRRDGRAAHPRSAAELCGSCHQQIAAKLTGSRGAHRGRSRHVRRVPRAARLQAEQPAEGARGGSVRQVPRRRRPRGRQGPPACPGPRVPLVPRPARRRGRPGSGQGRPGPVPGLPRNRNEEHDRRAPGRERRDGQLPLVPHRARVEGRGAGARLRAPRLPREAVREVPRSRDARPEAAARPDRHAVRQVPRRGQIGRAGHEGARAGRRRASAPPATRRMRPTRRSCCSTRPTACAPAAIRRSSRTRSSRTATRPRPGVNAAPATSRIAVPATACSASRPRSSASVVTPRSPSASPKATPTPRWRAASACRATPATAPTRGG